MTMFELAHRKNNGAFWRVLLKLIINIMSGKVFPYKKPFFDGAKLFILNTRCRLRLSA